MRGPPLGGIFATIITIDVGDHSQNQSAIVTVAVFDEIIKRTTWPERAGP